MLSGKGTLTWGGRNAELKQFEQVRARGEAGRSGELYLAFTICGGKKKK